MAHQSQINFCKSVKELYPNHFLNVKVLDCGSLDINGNNRYLFENCEYVGIDVGDGKNVDIVTTIHEFNADDNFYDTIISTEAFEHDMYFKDSLRNIFRILKPGGLFLFTCGTDGRPEHGTLNSDTYSSPLTCNIDNWKNYYGNVNREQIERMYNLNDIFSMYSFSYNHDCHDIYFYGIKKI